MKPLVSFIIPYYNAGNTILETVASIFEQKYNNYEIWIINDGSTDQHSLDVLTNLARKDKIKILHQDNAGPSVARNNAIKQTSAEIIIPLDADDMIMPSAIEKAIPFLMDNVELGVVYGDLQFFGGKSAIKKQVGFQLRRQFVFNQVAVCAFIKKSVFETCGYYDELLSKPGLEDWEFWIRVGEKGWGFKKINDVFFKIRVDEKSRTYQVANKNVESIKQYVFKKHASLLAKEYQNIFYENKMLLETPDIKIGRFFMKPYRAIKNFLKICLTND